MKYNHIIRILAMFAFLLAVIGVTMTFTGCGASTPTEGGRQLYDGARVFDRMVGVLPDGTVIKGEVDSWLDFDDCDQIQVTVNGDTYLFHSSNVVLIKERD